ncbi:MAG: hypothetical protein HGA78_03655 [Nitrospirales bacterium]|nr:hypothetical protein [Nitrospirales bacterium]
MKAADYTDIICKGYCRYYKEGKEDLLCGGYFFLRRNLTPSELKAVLKLSAGEGADTAKGDPALLEAICRGCDFFVDGCDFSDNESGPPCGGYIIARIISSS